MTTTHTQPAGCDLDRLRDLIANDGFAMSFQSMGQYRAALIAAARAAQAPQVGQDTLTDAQITAGADVLCDCRKPKRIGRNAAIDVFHAMTAAGAQIEQQAAQAPQGGTRQGAHTCTPADERAQPMDRAGLGWPAADDEQRSNGWTWDPDWVLSLQRRMSGAGWSIGCEVLDDLLLMLYRDQLNKNRSAHGAGTAPVGEAKLCGWIQFIDGEQTQNFARDEAELENVKWVTGLSLQGPHKVEYVQVFSHPAPVSTAPSKSPEFEGIGDAPVSTAAQAAPEAPATEQQAATTASASGELKECAACDGRGCTHYPDGEWQGKCGACKGTGIDSRAADGQQDTRALLDALKWYGDEARAIAENDEKKRTDGLMASMRVLSLDGGARARAALALDASVIDYGTPADGQQGASRAVLDEDGALIVATGVSDDAIQVIVSAKQGDVTTVLYSRRHSLNGDSIGTAALARNLPAQGAAQVEVEAARDAVLEEAAERLDGMNDASGDAAAYDNREQNIYELEREHAISDCAAAIRALKSSGAAKSGGA